ncbi:MBL fold metallo-hydrolase [Phycisphaera mikurensis]|uniref:Putative hydrolase n=1 Tax=Phycisphaera mikurensis (strain NBRC 102666 / KCTC 22515 / FYK2301M01) TaxID=1142394 RepID=I0IHB6_PHYMF|nr:MBL fold metallo-hydrolase [Phycisphaera mikurensis]MBB6440903.1 glyoxylase-like metal-dependent hydrolase (beta-lactamase superfamily II) [Phycisphaera mikurensis]BAM04654.1 putative hydrolase [Phycisphaera mikurensis NBRC 102666]
MPHLSRRTAIAAAPFAALAAAGLGRVAGAQEAAAPLPPTGNAGVYRTGVGAWDVAVVSDGHFFFDPMHPTLGGNVGAAAFAAAVEAAAMPADGLAHVNALLARKGDRVVLVDAGGGDAFAPTTGRLIANLATLGVEPAAVTDVLLTHAHPDHAGGLMLPGRDRQPAFANATVHVTEAEHAFWRSGPALAQSGVPEEMKAAVVKTANDALDTAGERLAMVTDGAEPVEGFTSVACPGHTPGHCGYLLSDGDATLYFTGDTIFFAPVLTSHPGWHVAFDTDPAEAAATRFREMDRIANERLRIASPHLPFPALAQLREDGAGGFRFLAEPWRFEA